MPSEEDILPEGDILLEEDIIPEGDILLEGDLLPEGGIKKEHSTWINLTESKA